MYNDPDESEDDAGVYNDPDDSEDEPDAGVYSDPDERGDADDDGSELDSDDAGAAKNQNGFADAMGKILNQTVKAQNPMLAKRTTEAMRQIIEDRSQTKRLKANQIQRVDKLEKSMVIPTFKTQGPERQFRKVATRGGEFK